MAQVLVVALTLVSATAVAQATDAGTPPRLGEASNDAESVRKDLEAKLEAARKEIADMRQEVRAQLATQSVAQGWQEDWTEQKRKLELFVPDGYFRVRPDLFHKFDLNRQADPAGFHMFPRSPTDARERTIAGVNMRFRFEPTLNVSEEVRVRMQIDALDNLLFGSTPDYAFSRSQQNRSAYDRDEFGVMSESQTPPRSGINSVMDSIAVKRVYGEVSTPVGVLRFGRMGSHWGLGMLRNDGNCADCDHGDTVDRLMFVTEPITGYYVTPMLDFNVEGPSSTRQAGGGQPFDLANNDDSHSFIIAVARRDMEQQAKVKLEQNQAVFNYGVHLTYRVMRNEAVDYYNAPFQNEGGDVGARLVGGFVPRAASLVTPDVWLKYERRQFKVELELAAVIGGIGNRALTGANAGVAGENQSLEVLQFGGVAQGEYRLMEGALKLGLEVGFASGDDAPGMGNYPRRRTGDPDNQTQPGSIDGPQYRCTSGGACTDRSIRNFRFNRDYRVDLILWREILGGLTDAIYFKPTADYRVAEGFNIFGSIIYSRAVFASSTPSWDGTRGTEDLGVELNAGARYETEDGFTASVAWGILFPMGGLGDPRNPNIPIENAQALRGSLGIRF